MSFTANERLYEADVPTSPNSVPYIGPDNGGGLKDSIELRRYAPVPTKNFSGVVRSTIKTVRTVTLTGALTDAHDCTISTSVTYGVGSDMNTVHSAMRTHADCLVKEAVDGVSISIDDTPWTELVDHGKLIFADPVAP